MGKKFMYLLLFSSSFICSKIYCQVGTNQLNTFLEDSAVKTGHVGISIYEPATGKYLYNYNSEKNFTPSSNVKLFTLYAGLKYLGDSLVGLRFQRKVDSLKIFATGDPTFLHPKFANQKVFSFLKDQKNIEWCSQIFTNSLGSGWAWDDYLEDFMTERSELPIYGNMIAIQVTDKDIFVTPKLITFQASNFTKKSNTAYEWQWFKNWNTNDLFGNIKSNYPKKLHYEIPMSTNNDDVSHFLEDTIHQKITWSTNKIEDSIAFNDRRLSTIFSQPVDSLFKPMMYNSDNFFAEQTLLMVSNEKLGYMSDEEIIDTLLKNDFKDIATKPRWVDGSGLSRYNLFSPNDFIYVLNKLQKEFGFARMKRILPTGGQGTLTNYYEKDAGFIYAKTGSMSNNVSLSGYLITKSNKQLLFSILINNYSGSGRAGRRAIEKFITSVRENN